MTKPLRILADWNTWAFIPTTTIREAVFLSLDLEPVSASQASRHLLLASARNDETEQLRHLREFNRRIKIACANIGLLAKFPEAYHRDIQNSKVSLSRFGAWAGNVGWSLPDKFPRKTAPDQPIDATDRKADSLTLVDIKNEPAPPQNTAMPAPSATKEKKWTVKKLAELKAYRDGHTMPQTAAKFGISEQRIRQLLPSGKSRAKPFAGLIHRMN